MLSWILASLPTGSACAFSVRSSRSASLPNCVLVLRWDVGDPALSVASSLPSCATLSCRARLALAAIMSAGGDGSRNRLEVVTAPGDGAERGGENDRGGKRRIGRQAPMRVLLRRNGPTDGSVGSADALIMHRFEFDDRGGIRRLGGCLRPSEQQRRAALRRLGFRCPCAWHGIGPRLVVLPTGNRDLLTKRLKPEPFSSL
jgi:hypothetical protein